VTYSITVDTPNNTFFFFFERPGNTCWLESLQPEIHP
jgi:hypothetical protein